MTSLGTRRLVCYAKNDLCVGCTKKLTEKPEKKGLIVYELPILDLISVVLSVVSIAITIFVAMGVIRIHKQFNDIQDDDEESEDRLAASNHGSSDDRQKVK